MLAAVGRVRVAEPNAIARGHGFEVTSALASGDEASMLIGWPKSVGMIRS